MAGSGFLQNVKAFDTYYSLALWEGCMTFWLLQKYLRGKYADG